MFIATQIIKSYKYFIIYLLHTFNKLLPLLGFIFKILFFHVKRTLNFGVDALHIRQSLLKGF